MTLNSKTSSALASSLGYKKIDRTLFYLLDRKMTIFTISSLSSSSNCPFNKHNARNLLSKFLPKILLIYRSAYLAISIRVILTIENEFIHTIASICHHTGIFFPIRIPILLST